MTNNDQNYDPERLARLVREDPTVASREKKFTIATWKEADKAHIFCAMASQMRELIRHESVTVTQVSIGREYGPNLKREPHRVTNGPVVAVWCKIPTKNLEVNFLSFTDSSQGDDNEG